MSENTLYAIAWCGFFACASLLMSLGFKQCGIDSQLKARQTQIDNQAQIEHDTKIQQDCIYGGGILHGTDCYVIHTVSQ